MEIGNIVGLIDEWSGGITQVGVVEDLPEQYSKFPDEVLVLWNDGHESWYSIDKLELICR